MADNSVFITGIAQGALGDALSDVPAWATEKTAGDMVEWLKKSYGKQSALLAQAIRCCKGGTGAGSPESKKVASEMASLGRTLNNVNAESEKSLKLSKDKSAADRQSLLGGQRLNNLGEKVNYVMAGLAAAGVKVAGVMTDYVDVYDSVYKSGINVLNGNESTADGFTALNQTVLLTGLRLQTLQQVAEKYSSSINAAGFQKFARATALSTTRLEALGFSSVEGAELTASLMEAETGFSDIRGKSAAEFANDAVKLGSQFGRLSITMGISRQQLLENMKTTAKSADSALVTAKWGAEAAENVAKTAAGIKDTNLRDAFTKMAAAADPVFTQVYKDLQAAGMGTVADQMGQIAREMRTADPAEIARRIDELQKSIPRGGIAGLADQIAGGNTAAQAAAEVITGLQQQGRIVSQATSAQADAATDTERSLAAFQTQTEKLSATAQAAFSPMIGQLDAATTALTAFNKATFGVIGAIDSELRSWLGIGAVITGFVAGLVIARGALTTFASLFGLEAATATSSVKKFGAGLGSVIKSLGSLALIAGAGFAGWEAGTAIKGKLEESEGGREFLDVLGGTITEVLAKAGNKEAQETIDRVDRNRLGQSSATTISVPTAPAASTINSPSAVSTPRPTPEPTTGVVSDDGSRSAAPAIPRPGANADINNLLSYQSSVLDRILLSTNALVSVNQDILRYARNSV